MDHHPHINWFTFIMLYHLPQVGICTIKTGRGILCLFTAQRSGSALIKAFFFFALDRGQTASSCYVRTLSLQQRCQRWYCGEKRNVGFIFLKHDTALPCYLLKTCMWRKYICNAVILPSHWSYTEQKRVRETPFTLLQDTVHPTWFWSCYFKVKKLHTDPLNYLTARALS